MSVLVLVVALGVAPVTSAQAANPSEAIGSSASYAANRGVTSYLSVVDRRSGAVLAQTGNTGSQVASESIMKLLLASYYLVLYGGYQQTPSSVLSKLSYMLRVSDDATASSLFSSAAIPTIAARYGLGRTINATDRPGHWGAARITASDMTQFLYRASLDNAVGPWLMPVMAQTSPTGSDGFNQAFGLNAIGGDHGSKQGWGCDSFWTAASCAIHSVGYTDKYFVAVLQLATSYPDPMRDTATFAARTIAASSVRADPIGSLDAVDNPAQNAITVAGWAADPDAPGQSEEVHIYVTGPAGTGGTPGTFTKNPRPDVAAAYPWAGGNTGYSATVPARGEGANTVCVFALNVRPPRTNPLIGCKDVQVRNAVGYLDWVAVGERQLTVAGWALNPNNPGEQVEVHLYDTGPSGARGYPGFRAGADRPDVAAAFPGYGRAHGLFATIPSVEAGRHTICAYAITTGGGVSNPEIGCRTVDVRDAFGYLDGVEARPGRITVNGWAANPNNPGEQVAVHLYDTSPAGTRFAATTAGGNRPDVAAALPGYGAAHGYSFDLTSAAPGRHSICTFAITTGGGASNPLLGCREVVVP